MILHCKIGRFIFAKDGKLSLTMMKLIRDSVMGHYYSLGKNAQRKFRSVDVYDYVENQMHIVIPFKIEANY